MRSIVRYSLTFLALGALQVHAADSAPSPAPAPKIAPQIDPKADAVLTSAGNYYSGLQSFQTAISATMKVEMKGMKTEMESDYAVAMARPNSFALILQSGMMGGTLVSDGKTAITYVPILKQYTSGEAPKLLSDLLDPMSMALITSGFPLGLEPLLSKDPIKSYHEHLTKAAYVGLEKIGDTPAQHIHLESGPYLTDLWFADGDAPLLLQSEVKLDNRQIMKSLSDEQKKKMPAGMADMKTERINVFSGWKTNQGVPPAVFTFQPPDGAKLVPGFGGQGGPEPVHPLVGKMAPDFQLKDLDGKDVSLASLRGKIVVLDFWATWCPPCVKSLPIVSEVTASLKDRGVLFYAVNLREKPEQISTFQKDKELAFPVLLDADGAIATLYQAKGIPQSVLIDKDGKIQAIHVGYRPDLKEKLTSQLNAMLDGKSLDAATPASGGISPQTDPPK
jgi:peroxiredoxin